MSLFRRVSAKVSVWMGHPIAFAVAVCSIVVWAALGPLFGFTDTWQLVINTGTTIITFLMVFLIQNTQNRDTRSLQLKLDELIRTNKDARNELIDLEDLSDEEMDELQKGFCELKEHFEGRVAEIHEHKKKKHKKH